MSYFHTFTTAAGLVTGMAERLDFDFKKRAANTDDTPRSFRELVERCAGCKRHEACAELQSLNLLSEEAPDYCQNKDVFTHK